MQGKMKWKDKLINPWTVCQSSDIEIIFTEKLREGLI
jgi:hypothetical protein